MTIKHAMHKWAAFVDKMNSKGIPFPMVRDPKTGVGSVSLTLVFLSSLWVQLGLLGKVVNAFGGINIDQAMQFFGICTALYFGRKWVGKDGTVDAEPKAPETPKDHQ